MKRVLCGLLSLLFLACLLTLGAAPAVAEERLSVGIGGADLDGRSGLATSLSISVHGGWLFLAGTPYDLTFHDLEASGRYRLETLSDGREVCRDTVSGRFAEKERCAPQTEILFGTMLSGGVRFPLEKGRFVSLAVGYRFGEGDGVVGAVEGSFPLSATSKKSILARGTLGERILQLLVGLAFPL